MIVEFYPIDFPNIFSGFIVVPARFPQLRIEIGITLRHSGSYLPHISHHQLHFCHPSKCFVILTITNRYIQIDHDMFLPSSASYKPCTSVYWALHASNSYDDWTDYALRCQGSYLGPIPVTIHLLKRIQICPWSQRVSQQNWFFCVKLNHFRSNWRSKRRRSSTLAMRLTCRTSPHGTPARWTPQAR